MLSFEFQISKRIPFKQWRTGNKLMKSTWRIFCKMKICPVKIRQKLVPAEAGADLAVP